MQLLKETKGTQDNEMIRLLLELNEKCSDILSDKKNKVNFETNNGEFEVIEF